MTKKQIKELLTTSFTEGSLDEQKVESIAASLKRRELKQYIKALKNWDKAQSIIIRAPRTPSDAEKRKFEDLFLGKNIHYYIDPSLLLGVSILDNDMEYELNLKSNLDSLLSHLLRRND